MSFHLETWPLPPGITPAMLLNAYFGYGKEVIQPDGTRRFVWTAPVAGPAYRMRELPTPTWGRPIWDDPDTHETVTTLLQQPTGAHGPFLVDIARVREGLA